MEQERPEKDRHEKGDKGDDKGKKKKKLLFEKERKLFERFSRIFL